MDNLKSSVLDEYTAMVERVYRAANNLYDSLKGQGCNASWGDKHELFSLNHWRAFIPQSRQEQFTDLQVAQWDLLEAACHAAAKIGTDQYYNICNVRNSYRWNSYDDWDKLEFIHSDNMEDYARNKADFSNISRESADMIRGCINWTKAVRELRKKMKTLDWEGQTYYY